MDKPRVFHAHVSAAVALALLLFAGCSRPVASPAPPHQTVDGMMVTLIANAPHSGDNTLELTLADAVTHSPIGNANITAKADMLSPSLPGSSVSGRAQGNGVYNIPVRLGIATRYAIALHIERTGKPPTDITFPLEAEE